MKLAVACDHAGFDLKQAVIPWVKKWGHTVIDLGTHNHKSVDYPDYAQAIAKALQNQKAVRGILICGSGVGASVAANKFLGIRAALGHDTYSAHQGVEHDNANVLCLGSRVVGTQLALELIQAFLKARFTGETRHRRRLAKIDQIERNEMLNKTVIPRGH
jgi:RpiB/LacA/LacB family sugar-phosphate isomerase